MRPVEAVRVGDWVLKGYHLTLAGAEIEPATVAAAVEHLGTIVEAPLEGEPSHGFYVLHHGEDALWLIVWTWRYADIVSVACSRASLDSPGSFTPLTEGLAGCVWELAALVHERAAWVRHTMQPAVPRPGGVPGRRPPGGPGRRSVGVAGQPASRPRAAGAGGGWSRGAATGDGYVAGWRSAPGCGRRWWKRRTTRPTDRTTPVRRRSGRGAVFGPLRRWWPALGARAGAQQASTCGACRGPHHVVDPGNHACASFLGAHAHPWVVVSQRSLGMSRPHVSHVSRPGTDRYPGGTEAHPKAAHTFDAKESSGRHWTTPMAQRHW